ncbi:MAG: hypothetical protein ABMB14_39505 [Myxococcota bacterium]
MTGGFFVRYWVSSAIVVAAAGGLAGCGNEWGGGTGVGNPGTTRIALAEPEPGVTMRSAGGRVSVIEAGRCDGSIDPEVVASEVDLLGAGPFPLPAGELCELAVVFDPPVTVIGDVSGGATFHVALDVRRVSVPVDPPFTLDGDALVYELGKDAWLDLERLGYPAPGDAVEIAPGSPLHDDVAHRLSRSKLFIDADGDGALSVDERAVPIGRPPDDDDDDDDD